MFSSRNLIPTYFTMKRKEEPPVTQVHDDIEDIDEESPVESEEHVTKAHKSVKKEGDGATFPDKFACVYKWSQIKVGQTYVAMSVGNQPRSRTGIVLVPK